MNVTLIGHESVKNFIACLTVTPRFSNYPLLWFPSFSFAKRKNSSCSFFSKLTPPGMYFTKFTCSDEELRFINDVIYTNIQTRSSRYAF